jgi:plastocyanin
VDGILLVAENNAFNNTNPDIHAKIGVPEKVTVLNRDFVRHDFVIDKLGVNTAYLRTEQEFPTAIASDQAGVYEYYCSIHPQMHGKVIIS